jgi:glutaconate CoA-transferase subunit A
MNKIVPLAEAVTLVQSGHRLALGGLTLYRRPAAFVYELLRRADAPRDLTLVCFTAAYESDLLVGAGLVRRVRSCYFGFEIFGFAPMFTEAAQSGTLDVMEESEASLTLGLRATLAGVGFMPGRAWLGTDLPRLRPDVRTVRNPYSDEELVAFPAIPIDVAVIHALRADPLGNAVLGGNLAVDPEIALAAQTVVVTAEEIAPPDTLTQVDVAAPMVTAVAHAPRGAWPTSCHPLYPVAGGEIMRYLEACGRGAFSEYLNEIRSFRDFGSPAR